MFMASFQNDHILHENNDEDIPITCTFADQVGQRKRNNKLIRKSVTESHQKAKELRRVKHNKKTLYKTTDENLGQINEKESTTDCVENEFALSSSFDALDHMNDQIHHLDNSFRNSKPLKLSRQEFVDESFLNNESDEGYDGSEEQDRKNRQNSDSSVHIKYKENEMNNNYSCEKRTNTNLRKRIQIQLLNNTFVEQTTRKIAEKFKTEQLFSIKSTGGYGDVRRINVRTLKSLAKKQKIKQRR